MCVSTHQTPTVPNSLIEVRTIVYCDIQGHVAFKYVGEKEKRNQQTDTFVTIIVIVILRSQYCSKGFIRVMVMVA